jgi:hypothetical protein
MEVPERAESWASGGEAGVDGTTPRAVGWLDLSAPATICSYDGIAAALCYS